MQSPIRNAQQAPPPQQMGPQFYQPPATQPVVARRRLSLNRFMTLKSLLIFVAILQVIMIILILNPASLIQQFQNQQVINEVSGKTTVPTGETPVVATVTSADQLRQQNAAQAQVYKDAQNGDYVLGYSSKMIIFRKSSGTIIYDGDNPNDLVTKAQTKIITDITDKAKAQSLIPNDSTEKPQISIITDVKSLQTSNAKFYSIARNNDIVALFPESQVILLYNQETSTIVNSGKYTTDISTL